MSKFSGSTTLVRSPIHTTGEAGMTHQGGAGYARDAKSELFLLAVSNMVREDTFYESGTDRDDRYIRLIEQVTQDDPAWVRAFVPFLRDTMHLRSASLVMAAEYVRAGGLGGRRVVSDALKRADEPAEMLGYWTGVHGRAIPKPVKRGVADAVTRLYDERSALKYDGQGSRWRMADVIDLVHPTPVASWQGALFRFLLARRHGRDTLPTEGLSTITAALTLEAMPKEHRRMLLDHPDALRRAGFTWERLSGWLDGPMDAAAWEAIIPSMGYMALLRNLRNFEDAKVSVDVLESVAARIKDPAEVARSQQLPLRFYSAWKATGSMTWGPAIESALDAALANVPVMRGRTLVLIDVSGSMIDALSGRSKAMRWELAALFGTAIARRAEHADVYAFHDHTTRVAIRESTSLLRSVDAIRPLVGGGTDTAGALRTYDRQDRVVILTDEQVGDFGRPMTLPDVPVYTFNLAGYSKAHAPSSGKHHTFGGLTDAGFIAMDLIERQRDSGWGFLSAA